jgi:DNA-binding IclR family transcriptional regulator
MCKRACAAAKQDLAVFRALAHVSTTIPDIAQITGINRKIIERILPSMEREGLVFRKPLNGRTNLWALGE